MQLVDTAFRFSVAEPLWASTPDFTVHEMGEIIPNEARQPQNLA
jgi:hypothetical protein